MKNQKVEVNIKALKKVKPSKVNPKDILMFNGRAFVKREVLYELLRNKHLELSDIINREERLRIMKVYRCV
jgi:hypothetical protein